jgi:flagellar hook-length control protein FliK
MPSAVENSATTILLPPTPIKSPPPKTDGDSFDKVLQDARPKADEQKPQSSKEDDSDTKKPADKSGKVKHSQPKKKIDAADKAEDESDEPVDKAKEKKTPLPQQAAEAVPTDDPKPVKVEKNSDQPASSTANDKTATDISAKAQTLVTADAKNVAHADAADEKPATVGKPMARVVQNPNGQAAKTQENKDPKEAAGQDQTASDENQNELNEGQAAQVAKVVSNATARNAKPQADAKQVKAADENGNALDEELRPVNKAKVAKTIDSKVDDSLQNFAAIADDASDTNDSPPAPTHVTATVTPTDLVDAGLSAKPQAPVQHLTTPQAAPAPTSQPETEFAATNHDKIISTVRTQLLPNGGTMQIRLDPPELGQMQVTVRMNDGVMTASFETSNDQATKLLSHSLGQLKDALETQGVSVEKLHVQQAPKNQQGNSSTEDQKQQAMQDGKSSQRDQQRREMLRRMWAKLGVGDPLDMVA